jgi:hypothetical protein
MNTPAWVTASGEHIPLGSMAEDHIKNVMRYLLAGDGDHGPMTRPGCSGFTNGEWLRLCAAELTRRHRR